MENIIDVYELSLMQQGMLFHTLYAPESGVYFEQRSCLLKNLDVDAFKLAWQKVVARHPILRTAFYWEEVEKPLQVVYQQATLPWLELNWENLTPQHQHTQLESFLQTDCTQGFDLKQAPLMRCALIKVQANTHYFVWSHHHVLMDGWCNALLLQEVFAFYQAACANQALYLPPPLPYRHYIEWLQQQDHTAAAKFWQRSLANFTAPTPLFERNVVTQPQSFSEQQLKLPPTVTNLLQNLAQKQRLTLNTIVQGAWAILLSRYSKEEDVVFGVTVSGRPPELAGVESIIGLFINTVPVRVHLPANAEVSAWLQQLQAQQIEREPYVYTSLVDIQQSSQIPRGTPLFESLIVFENYPVSIDTMLAGVKGIEISQARGFDRTNYPLTLTVIPGEQLSLHVSYDCNRFTTANITRLLAHLQTLLGAIATNPQQCISYLPLVTATEQQLCAQWNNTHVNYPDTCIQTLFEQQVNCTPDAVAIVFEQHYLTYHELNTKANQLAHYLLTLGVKPDTVVGLCVKRSPEMIIGLLGILKAGAAYLPLDPTYPPARLAYMLEDAQVSVLIGAAPAQHICKPNFINLDTDWEIIATSNNQNPPLQVTPDNLAYVIYTSGSTGNPKGVMIPQRALVNYTLFAGQEFAITAGSRILQFASVSFDAAGEEIYPCLTHGGTLVLRTDDWISTASTFIDLCAQSQITILDLPTAYWYQILCEMVAKSFKFPACLRLVIIGGEAVTPDAIALWQQHIHNIRLLNTYGPTEATIVSTYREVADAPPTVAIGKPIANTQVYVLDAYLNPVGIGVVGELYISGAGVARGYLNQPAQTALKFIPAQNARTRMYKTGDRVRYREDGNLEFIDRIDTQIQLRGFRIEPGEIETILQQHPAIQVAIVTLQENVLVAYIVPSNAHVNSDAERTWLAERLPQYMIPAQFVTLDALPLTPSGKINRRALPTVEKQSSRVYAQPRTVTEELLTGIWAEVLNLTQVSINDNFFEVGGHSLLATRVLSQIRQVFTIELPLRRLFEKPTIAQLAPEIDATSSSTAAPIQRISCQEIPLSFAQQRLWFLAQLEPSRPDYNIAAAVNLTGLLNINAFNQSFDEIINRHQTLRTAFVTYNEQAQQQISSTITLEIPIIDLSAIESFAQALQVQQLADQEAQQPFNLERTPLLRVKLIRLNATNHVLLLTLHHIIADGWSIAILIRELATLYPAFCQKQRSPLPPLSIQYADFAAWQRQSLPNILENQLRYWQQQLHDAPPLLMLPTDYPRPPVRSWRGNSCTFELSGELSTQLKRLSQKLGCTLFMTLLAAFQTLLYRYTGSDDIVVGTAIANRNRAEIEPLIGFFVNTLALRTDFAGNPSFAELLHRVREVTLGAYAHQDLPFEQLVDTLQLERSLSYTPLFQVMFVFQAPIEPMEIDGLHWSVLKRERNTAKFDLTLSIEETATTLTGVLEYSLDLFQPATIERMVQHLQTLLNAIITQPEQRISELSLLTPYELRQLLGKSHQTRVDYPRDMSVQQVFENQVTQSPDAIALVYDHHQLTYQQLNHQASQLAQHLRTLGVQSGTRVGICLERSLEAIIAILGVLKANGTYIPLDPQLPPARIAFILEDAHISVVIRDLQPGNWQIEVISTKFIAPDNIAYIMYTSGSTGIPKGVCTPHRGIIRLVKACNYVNLSAAEILLQAAPLSFDASTFEIWGALLNGGKLVLLPTPQPSLEVLGETIEKYQISTLWLTAGLFHLMVDEQLHQLKVQQLLAGGDVLSPVHVHKFQQRHPNCQLINGYGPTESTTFTCCYPISKNHQYQQIPLGYPISNTCVYVLDKHLQLVPEGVPGELYIGGDGLALGYLNQPKLTAEKFLPNPFFFNLESNVEGQVIYKTGDCVRYCNGVIEYLGRLDNQVKIRGFRVELGEIEATLCQHSNVKEAVVIVQTEQNHQQLIAYIVLAATTEIEFKLTDLRVFLADRLPEYLIPHHFIHLESLPLTINGKVDRSKLPVGVPTLESEFVRPITHIERTLTAIWEAILKLEQVGIHDNFFALGGDSILAIQVVSRANQAAIQISPKQLFQYQTIAELATVATQTARIVAEQDVVTGFVPLTPIQHWFFAQNLTNPHYFNQAVLLTAKTKLNLESLTLAIAQLLLHHDALRLRFEQTQFGWRQFYAPPSAEVPITYVNLSMLSAAQQQVTISAIAHQVQLSINLSTAVVRVVLFDLGSTQPNRLLFVIHHLVVDSISWRILLADFQTAYQQVTSGEAIQLPPKTTSFKYWAESLRKYAQSVPVVNDYLVTEQISLPVDYGTRENAIATSDDIIVSLSPEYTQALLKDIPQSNTQISEILLTALGQTFTQWMGNASLHVDVEAHGRVELFDNVDVSRTVGWFTNLFPVQLIASADMETALISVKKQLNAPNQGIDYSVHRFLQPNSVFTDAVKHQAEVCFNYLGQDVQLPVSSVFASQVSLGLKQDLTNQRCYLIEINGSVIGEQLTFIWTYSQQIHRQSTIVNLARDYLDKLTQLIEYCLSQKDAGSHAFDFLIKLEQNQLDDILAQVEFET